MATLQPLIQVCDFCLGYHERFASKQHTFNFAQKQAVAKCCLCKTNNLMCGDCYANSTLELTGSILAKFGFAICRNCIVEKWRTTDIQERLEAISLKRIEEAQEKMREDVYLLTEKLQWQES